ncbi:cadmium-translocating P-type ATPase [Salicibibacter cibarius]|uniref:Cd(2+)-exporting ATPase n=2 Tax=Salicibibacter TaxID=2685905 RepID=A0A514LMP0_9BACI|nr:MULTISPECIES: heavy metal translocating P-type ATPase [Salicibibacter]QDI93132.1 cadmium-translocating P-type ATPase [Salicibibacter halophilus]QQK78141.1 cadmium-translocating P-type ATPase [Salicibibacter cibarius]
MAGRKTIMADHTEKTDYRVQGFSCANCANTFEKNVQRLDGVTDAQVNFGASKITVYGSTTKEELEKAGSFENLKVRSDYASEESEPTHQPSFFQKYQTVLLAILFFGFGVASQIINGEDNLLTWLAYATSMVVGGYTLFKAGLMNLMRLRFDMKTLMTVAVIGAAIIGEWAEGAIVVILFAISEELEGFSMDRARQSIRSLMDIAPKEALIKRNGQEMSVHVDDIAIGDIMIVKPGQKAAMDGVVVSGHSSINQAAVTGESIPVEKNLDDEVFAGTLNEEGFLEVRVTKYVEDTTISKVIHLVEEAQAERAPAQAFVDRFAAYYTPAVMVLAMLVAVLPPLVMGASWEAWIYQGLAVLVVACPCALVISTPVSIVTAIGNAAKNGVLIKGGAYLEEAGSLKAIAFDKTGTLTKGVPVVTDFSLFHPGDKDELLAKVTALESRSQHPLASAIVDQAKHANISYQNHEVQNFNSITGKGVKGTIDGTTYYVGNLSLWEDALGYAIVPEIRSSLEDLQKQGKTGMFVGTDQSVLALIAVADEVRDTSQEVITKLHDIGIDQTIMLTGDHQDTASAIGKQVGVTDVQANLLPEDKLSYVKAFREKYRKVAMVGDGVNDAPALAASNVGIAMGVAGTDTALETADVALMGDDLQKLPYTMKLSRRALRIIKQNISFSLGIKLLALLLVIPGWLTLWIAILADVGATLLVTANGLRLLRVKD